MFNWFGRRSNKAALIGGQIGRMIDQMALATAVAEAMGAYYRANKIIPISTDKTAAVVDIWNGTRFEAISRLWNFGATDLNLIINPTTHPILLDAIVSKAMSHLYSREPKNDEIDDTVSAILRVYDYLENLERDVAVPFFQVSEKNPAFISKYGPFIEQMKTLQMKWQGFSFALEKKVELPEQPETVFSVLWRDVTRRSKTIALCARFGPRYMNGVQSVIDYVAKHNENSCRFSDSVVKILSADDPDQLSAPGET